LAHSPQAGEGNHEQNLHDPSKGSHTLLAAKESSRGYPAHASAWVALVGFKACDETATPVEADLLAPLLKKLEISASTKSDIASLVPRFS